MGSYRRENRRMKYWTVWLQACWLHCSPPSIWPHERNTGDVIGCDWPKWWTHLFFTFINTFGFHLCWAWESWFLWGSICYTSRAHCVLSVCVCLPVYQRLCIYYSACLDLCSVVCLPAANQPLWAELEVLLPPIGLGQLRHSIRGWTTAHQENLLGSIWFSVTEGEALLMGCLKSLSYSFEGLSFHSDFFH